MRMWKCFGSSVIGPGHIKTGKPNQDSWAEFHTSFYDLIVVSDGLGSKKLSHVGSVIACQAVNIAVLNQITLCDDLEDLIYDEEEFIDDIRNQWLNLLSFTDYKDCSATCLFAVRFNNGYIWFGMLGDGCVAIKKNDGSSIIFTDDKSEGFSNITTSLSKNTDYSSWKINCIRENECKAIVLFSDGISDDLTDINGFVDGFVDAYCNMPTISAIREIRNWLIDWPTPKHTDDKTIVCMYQTEVSIDEDNVSPQDNEDIENDKDKDDVPGSKEVTNE